MIDGSAPTPAEHAERRRMTRQEIGRVSQRAPRVLGSARRQSVPDMARIFEVKKGTGRYWLRRFDESSWAALYDAARRGRPAKITKAAPENVIPMVAADPQQSGERATCWTVAMLSLALLNNVGIPVSDSSGRATMLRLGLRWSRPHLSRPDKVAPPKARNQWAIAQASIEAPPETVVLYEDAARLQRLPLVRAMGQWAGKQRRLPAPGNNGTRTLVGALNPVRGDWTYLVRGAGCTEDFLAFLDHLLAIDPVDLRGLECELPKPV